MDPKQQRSNNMTIIEAIEQGIVTRDKSQKALDKLIAQKELLKAEWEKMSGFKQDMFATTKIAPVNESIHYFELELKLLTKAGK
jgi:hypothetical protein